MRVSLLTLSLFCLAFSTLNAQAGRKAHPITKDSYKMVFEVQKNKSLKILSFKSTKGKKYRAQITSPGDIPLFKLEPGSKVEGTYRFSSFASAGGLGSTRAYKGNGDGVLRILKISDAKGQKLKAERSSAQKLGIKLK